MICGNQLAYGLPGDRYCAERKADGLPMCEECFDATMAEYGHVAMAPGNALGAPQWAVRLLWEPTEGERPIEASAEELARYAGILAGGAQ
jgi:hypothetical protein